ncbi:MAG: hypothetical protein O6649_01910, partial [Gammaproteobacteria bacterium]|nr:hypothetical protein [Gammaproteobacteria bacterium]
LSLDNCSCIVLLLYIPVHIATTPILGQPPSPTVRTDSEQVVKGIIALVAATLFFAAQDAITKHLTQSISVAQIVSVRFFFFSLFALIFAARKIGISGVYIARREYLVARAERKRLRRAMYPPEV